MRLPLLAIALAISAGLTSPLIAQDKVESLAPDQEFKLPHRYMNVFALSSDGARFVIGTPDGKVDIYSAEDGALLHSLGDHEGDVSAVAFNSEGTLVASGGLDGLVRLSDVETGQETLRLEAHDGAVGAVAFSPDGRQIATGAIDWVKSTDRTVRTWDTSDGSLLMTFDPNADKGIVALIYSPDGRRLAVAQEKGDGLISVIDARNGKVVKRMAGVHESGVRQMAFSPDGRLLATGSNIRVGLWDPRNWASIDKLDIEDSDGIYGLAFTPDSQRIVVSSREWWTLWSAWTPIPHLRSTPVAPYFIGTGMTPDGRTIFAGTGDGRVLRWTLPETDE